MRWPLWRVAVVERSMEPALHPGDWLLVWRGGPAGRAARIRPGQLVIARHPGPAGPAAGEAGRAAEPGGWWLAADNPPAGAADSRTFGVVPDRLIEGRVLAPLLAAAGAR